jgi:LuxR family maltose regulon positive regulatory protein
MALLGLALWSGGDLEGALTTYAEGIARVHRGGYVNDSSAIMLSDIRVAQGRLREALITYQQALRFAQEQGPAAPRGVADLHVGISEIYLEQGDLKAAGEHLSTSRAMGELAGLPENRYRWFTAMAYVKRAQNDFEGALALLEEAERLYAGGFSPDLRPIAAMRARIWIAQGRLAEAIEWSRERGLSPADEPVYLREYEHITFARLLLARYEADPADQSLTDAIQLLARLLSAAEAGGRHGAVIEVLVLRSLALRRQGDRVASRAALGRALALAEPEGYARVFLEEGPDMTAMLEEEAKQAGASYARRLLAGFHRPKAMAETVRVEHNPLSERELEVIRLLDGDLSGPDIARELFVSLNTVRTHTKSIYTKLGVNSRRAAISRARELHLL